MQLDNSTIIVMTVTICVPLTILLFVSWLQNRADRSLAWWSATYFVSLLGIALYAPRGTIPNVVSIDLANALMILGIAFGYAGARAFNGRRTPIWLVLLGPGLWLVACRSPLFYETMALRVAWFSVLYATLAVAAAIEYWRGRGDGLKSRYLLVIALTLLAAFYAGRIAMAALMPMPEPQRYTDSMVWILLSILAPTVVAIAIAVLVVVLSKERTESAQRFLAEIDPLTGVPNRGATLARIKACVSNHSHGTSAAVLLFDLDHFKQINDRFGHPKGDEVLRIFAEVATAELREQDVFGRIGGEEFLAFLPGRSHDGALILAERIRQAFAAIDLQSNGMRIPATVSIGVAVADRKYLEIDVLLSAADKALYGAKKAGRDQVNTVRSAAA